MVTLSGSARYRVEAAFVEWVTTAETAQTQPGPAQGAVDLDRFPHVIRTGRIVAARGRKKGRNHALVPPEGAGETGNGEFPHRIKIRWTSRWRSENMQSAALRRGLNTTHHPSLSDASSSRAASRTRRRMRFRLTALPSARGVVKPTARLPPGTAR